MSYIGLQHIEPYPKSRTDIYNEKRRSKPHSRPIFICPRCDSVWVIYRNPSVKWEYRLDFPKYGQQKRLCPDCGGKL